MDCRKVPLGFWKPEKEAEDYILSAFRSGRLSYGDFTRRFEEAFAAMHGCKNGIFLNSGTSALHTALAVARERGGWNDGDEVIVPAVTFVATANIVLHCGLRPVFVDVKPGTLNIDPERIPEAVTVKTRAIIPVHLLGRPADMGPILAVASSNGLIVIEDSAECIAAKYNGCSVGSMGAMGCFSTYMAHILTTGVGGFITTNDDELAVMCRSYMNHGRDPAYLSIDDDDSPEGLERVVQKRYSFDRAGHSFRATEMEAALGMFEMGRLGAQIQRRRENFIYLHLSLRSLPVGLPDKPPLNSTMKDTFTPMFFPILIHKGPEKRNALMFFLERRGIETRTLFPLYGQPVYERRFHGEDLFANCPWARSIAGTGLILPCHHGLEREDMDWMIQCIGDFFKGA